MNPLELLCNCYENKILHHQILTFADGVVVHRAMHVHKLFARVYGFHD